MTHTNAAADAANTVTRIHLAGRDGEEHTFTGKLLGHGTSQVEFHTHPAERDAAPGEKCSACRWFEVAVYRRYVDAEVFPMRVGDPIADAPRAKTLAHDYVVHTVGGSSVPGEDRRSRVSYTSSAFEVIELLTVRPRTGEPFIAQQSARALAQASSVDAGVREAYINRAVI